MSHGYANVPSDLSALTEQDLRLQTGDIQSWFDDVRQQIFDHYLIKLGIRNQKQWTLIDTARVHKKFYLQNVFQLLICLYRFCYTFIQLRMATVR